LPLLLLLLQTLASPLSGILGDRYNRVAVLSTGAFIWGIMTSAMALTVTLHQVR
jgi:MFS family permease